MAPPSRQLLRTAGYALGRSLRSPCHYCGERNESLIDRGVGLQFNVVDLGRRRWAHKACIVRRVRPTLGDAELTELIEALDASDTWWWLPP